MSRAEDVPPLPPAWSGRAPAPTYSWRPGDPLPGDIPAAQPMNTAGGGVNATRDRASGRSPAGTEAGPGRGQPSRTPSARRPGCAPTGGTHHDDRS